MSEPHGELLAKRNAGDPGLVLARRLSNAEFDYSIREYRDGSQFACGIAPGANDRIGSATLIGTWRPERWLSFILSGQYQKCSSDISLANYSASIFSA